MSSHGHPEVPSVPIRMIHLLMEWGVILLVTLSPWAYAGIEPFAVFGIHLVVAFLLVLWALRIFVEKRLWWRGCPILLVLTGFLFLSGFQLVPLPEGILKTISPSTWQTYTDLLPDQPEMLPGESTVAERLHSFPLSLSPYHTRIFLIQLLVLFVLYSLVVTYLVSKAFYRRLAWICLLNGSFLTLLGLAQFFSSHSNTMFWDQPIDGAAVFSSFICRNHFSDYANLCFGLGLVLLISSDPHRRKLDFSDVLQQPRVLWVLIMLSFLLVGIGFSLSRGGLLSTLGSGLICALIWLRQAGWERISGLAIGISVMVIVLFGWLGTSPIDRRLQTLVSEEVRNESRLVLWEENLHLVGHFPIIGVGNGTYEVSEPMSRSTQKNTGWFTDHAHNEYIEALYEGGILRFCLVVLLLVILFRKGIRALPKLKGRSSGVMILGGLYGLLALTIHSVFDFGIHMPAVTLLATVVAALMMGTIHDMRDRRPHKYPFAIGIIVSMVGLGLAGLLVWEGWTYMQGHYSAKAALAVTKKEDSAILQNRITRLRLATQYQPENASYFVELGQAYLSGAGLFPKESPKYQAYLTEALKSWRHARNLCLLLPQPHARLGIYRDRFSQADSAAKYFDRARKLLPVDPDIWYVCGLQSFENGDFDRAWDEWKRSLEFGPNNLTAILRKAITKINSQEIANRILPDDVEILRQSAILLYPDVADHLSERTPIIKKAVALAKQKGTTTGKQSHQLAQWLGELEDYDGAIKEYHRANQRTPGQLEWYFELAHLALEADRIEEAEKAVESIKREWKNDPKIVDRIKEIEREIKLKK